MATWSRYPLSRRRAVTGAAVVAIGAVLAACGQDRSDTETVQPTATTGGAARTAPAITGGTVGANGTAGATANPMANVAVAGTPVVVEGKADGMPVMGGTLTIADDEPPTFDPRVSGATNWWRTAYAVFDTLLYQEPGTLNFQPGLAQSWEVGSDGRTCTLRLRQGVTFHDGEPFNAEAVKYTFDSIMDPALKSLTAVGYMGPYDRTEVVDTYTARVHFKEPYAPFLNNLAHSVLAPVSPKAGRDYNAFAVKPVGTGPFMFKEHKPQTSITLERFPNYKPSSPVFRNKGPAYLERVVYRYVPALETRLGLLRSGEAQLSNGVAPQELKNLQMDPNFQVLLPIVPGSPQIHPLNLLKAPTDDLKVRQAMNHAVDMPAIVDALWFGGRRAARGPLSSPTFAYEPAVENTFTYDAKKAATLLDEAGWRRGSDGVRVKDGKKLEVLTIISTGIEAKGAELMQAYLRDAGFINPVDAQQYAQTATRFLAGEHNIARIFFSHTDPVVLTTLYHSKNIPGTNFNRLMKPDAKMDAMLDAATAEMNAATRKTKYSEIQKYIMDNAMIIPRWEERVFWAASAKLRGIHFQPLGGLYLNDVWIGP